MTLPFGLSLAAAAYLAVALLVAAFVRGYSGFGFAALVVSSSSLVMNPLVVVPMVMVVDAVMTLQQARGIWADINWRRVAALYGGALVGVPVGIWAISTVGVDTARAVIAVYVLGMCALLLAGWQLRGKVGAAPHVGVGVVSGLANAAAVGGLPVAAFFAAQPLRAAEFRATLIAYFTLLDIWSLVWMRQAGMISRETLVASAFAVPILAFGIWLGGRHFLRSAPENFRRFAVILLAVLAVLGLVKSVV
jgi:uncharacterized protein